MTTPTHGRRPNLAPTSPHTGGDLHAGDLAPRPLPFGGEVSPESPEPPTSNIPTPRPRGDVNWSPDHPSTRAAWNAVLRSLIPRGDRELWSSRTLTISIASTEGGLTHERATDLIRSAIKHGYLEVRDSPTGCSRQVRLPKDGSR